MIKTLFDIACEQQDAIRATPAFKCWIKTDAPHFTSDADILQEWKAFNVNSSNIDIFVFVIHTVLITCYHTLLCRHLASLGWKGDDESLVDALKYVGANSTAMDCFTWPTQFRGSSQYTQFSCYRQEFAGSIAPDDISYHLFTLLLKEVIPLKARKHLGEEFTDHRIVNCILDQVGYRSNLELWKFQLGDPAAGMGAFLIEALSRLIQTLDVSTPSEAKALLIQAPVRGIEVRLFSSHACQLATTITLTRKLAQRKLMDLSDSTPWPSFVHQGDTLERSFLEHSTHHGFIDGSFDFIIGNPPYVRIQNIPADKRRVYVSTFKSATGRFDLAYLFVERALELLKSGGMLGFIISNKFMTTAAGKGVRRLIRNHASLKFLTDLSDTGLFEATVLPCVLVAKRRDTTENYMNTFRYTLVRKVPDRIRRSEGSQDIFTALMTSTVHQQPVYYQAEGPTGRIGVTYQSYETTWRTNQEETWHFMQTDHENLITAIRRGASTTLGDFAARITVGIKTTADNVFIRPLTQKFVEDSGLEAELIHPLIMGENVQRWFVKWNTTQCSERYVLYPHEKRNGHVQPVNLDDYPKVKEYFNAHRKELERRHYLKEAGRQWFEIWVYQDPDYFRCPRKIVTPDITNRNTFAIDEQQFFVGGSALAILLRSPGEVLHNALLGILNSTLMEFFHKLEASTFIYAGRYRYWVSHLKSYPLPDLSTTSSRKTDLQALAKSVALVQAIATENPNSIQLQQLEDEIDARVFALYGLTDKQGERIRTILSRI